MLVALVVLNCSSGSSRKFFSSGSSATVCRDDFQPGIGIT